MCSELRDAHIKVCEADENNKKHNEKPIQESLHELESSVSSAGESSTESDDTFSGLSEILSNIFADTDEEEEEFECFLENGLHESADYKVLQTNNETTCSGIQDKSVKNCCSDGGKNQNVISLRFSSSDSKSSSSEENSDVSSIESDGSQSGLSEILSDIFADTDDSDEEFKGFVVDDVEEMNIMQENCVSGIPVKDNTEKSNCVISPPASNEVCKALFSDYSSDEDTKKLKKTIAEYMRILELQISSDEETEKEELMEKKQKCRFIVEDDRYNAKIIKNEGEAYHEIPEKNGMDIELP